MPSRNRDTDEENKHMDTKQEREGGMNWEIGIDIHTLLIPCTKHRGASQVALVVKNLPPIHET